MSAYVVDKAHIDAIVRVAIEGPDGIYRGPGREWYGVWDEETQTRLGPEDADRIGTELWTENVRSVAYRYPQDASGGRPGPLSFTDDQAFGYTYDPNARRLTVVEAFQAIHGLDYQSCEHPEWRHSWAREFLMLLQDALVRRVPGYREADAWSITNQDA